MRFLVRFQFWLLLVVAGGLGLLFWLQAYSGLAEHVVRPEFGPYFGLHRDMVPVALTPQRYLMLRLGLAVGLLVALGGLVQVRRAARSTKPLVPVGRRGWAALRWLGQPVQQLRTGQRCLAAGLVAVVALARLYYAASYPLSLDEIASYDYSVLPGAAVTASYYPFPNNHLLANLLAGLVHGVLPGASPMLALRLLPTLVGVLLLPVVYALALRHLRFAVTTLGLGLYWLSPMGVYYAVAGRGYAWALLAALAGLFATAELLRPNLVRAARQRAWAVFGLSGVLGLYAVPTHLFVLLGLGLGLLGGFWLAPARARRLKLAQLAVVTLGVGIVAALLYAPVGAVTGWPALLTNRYVARHPWPEFSQGIGPFLLGTATELLGQRGLSALAFCGVLGLVPVALRWGQLPAPARRLGWLLWLQLGVWLPVVMAQRVYPPARTLLLVLLAFFLLLGLLVQVAWAAWATGRRARFGNWLPVRRLAPLGLVLVLGAYGGYRLHREQAIIGQQQRQQQVLLQAYRWLQGHPLRRIWVEPRPYAIFWQHYALSAGQQPLPLVVVYDAPSAQAGLVGEVEVLKPGTRLPSPPSRELYRNEQVLIVPVSPAAPLIVE
jgi:hypothetical protein